MKGISPMIATVLLLAFTVAVGGIISVWLTGMTRTQTAAVTTTAQCASTRLDVTADPYASGGLLIRYTNLGPEVVYPKNITVTCGTNTTSTMPIEFNFTAGLPVGQSNSLTLPVSGCVTNNNLTVRMVATCGSDQKGTVLSECKNTNC